MTCNYNARAGRGRDALRPSLSYTARIIFSRLRRSIRREVPPAAGDRMARLMPLLRRLSLLLCALAAAPAASAEGCDSDECDGDNSGVEPWQGGGGSALSPFSSNSSLQFSIFMGMQYYGPPEPLSTYHTIAAAAQKLAPAPFFISVCCDHNDRGGGAENRSGDPADGGWIVPICRRNDTEGKAVRKGIAVLREAGVHVLHYTHTRLAYWPNGSEYACCQCCEKQSYVERRIAEETTAFPRDGIFNDNVIASWNWLSYYQAISDAVHKTDRNRAMATNLDCASGAWPDFKSPATGRCSPVCMQFGHTSEECSWCRSPRCANLTQEFFDIADVHIMAETTRKMVTDPNAYQMHLQFPKTVANRNKMSMFTYGAHDEEWKTLIDLAAAQGYTCATSHPLLPPSHANTCTPWNVDGTVTLVALAASSG